MRIALAVTLLAVAAGPLAAQKPDFSGSWKLNQAMSDSLPLGGPGGPGGQGGAGERRGGRGMMGPAAEMFITQLTSRMTVEQKVADQARTSTYSLDGSESRNPGMMGREFVTTTTWVDNTLVTKGKNSFTTPMGDMTVESSEVRALSEDGKRMTVTMNVTTPRGTMTRKLVYDKQ